MFSYWRSTLAAGLTLLAIPILVAGLFLISGCTELPDNPAAPEDFSTAPRHLWTGTGKSGEMHAQWQPPVQAAAVQGYRVWLWTSDQPGPDSIDLPSSTTSLTQRDIRHDVPYIIQVAAILPSGVSARANVLHAAPGAPGSRRTPAAMYDCGGDGNGVSIRWYRPEDTVGLYQYELRWKRYDASTWQSKTFPIPSDDFGVLGDMERPMYRVDGLDPDTPYFFTAVMHYRNGNSAMASVAWSHGLGLAGRGTPPQPPRNLTAAAAGPRSVQLQWDRSLDDGPIDYRVWINCYVDPEGQMVSGGNSGSLGLLYDDILLLHDRASYSFLVTAVRYGVESAPIQVSVPLE